MSHKNEMGFLHTFSIPPSNKLYAQLTSVPLKHSPIGTHKKINDIEVFALIFYFNCEHFSLYTWKNVDFQNF